MPMSEQEANAVYGAAGDIISAGINAYAQGRMNKKTRKYNEQMYERQRADALADWNRVNAYNHPTQQMQRLREGGLNPNLAYGGGAQSLAAPFKTPDAKGWTPSAPQFDLRGVMLGARQVAAQITNTQKQTELAEQQRINGIIQGIKTTTETKGLDIDNKTKEGLQKGSLELQQLSLDKAKQDIQFGKNQEDRNAAQSAASIDQVRATISNMKNNDANIRAQLEGINSDNALKKIDLIRKQMGIEASDNMVFRVIAQIMHQSGAGIKEALGALKEMMQSKK